MSQPVSSRTHALLAALALATALLAALAAPASAQTAHPDVVRLRNGTMMRGTISEQTADHLVIVLPTGEVRTYPMSEVESAGPAQPVAPPPPAAAPPPPSYGPPMARVRVTADEDELSLQQLTGSASVTVWTGRTAGTARVDQFSIICNAPCDTEIPAGTYQLGIAQGTGDAQRAGRPLDLRGTMDLHLDYEDRTALRVAGWIVFIAGSLGGALLMTLPVLSDSNDVTPGLVGGAVVVGLSWAVGYPLIFLNNHAEVEVRF